jgi:hypothetical protein
MAEAWAESWAGGAETPHPLSEEERSLLDTLIRDLHASGAQTEASAVLRVFGLEIAVDEASAIVGEAGGTMEGWAAFNRWFGYVLENASETPGQTRYVHASSGRFRIDWTSENGFCLKEWFTNDGDRTRSFRRELLGRCLEKLRAKLHWDPEEPQLVSLEVLLKAPRVSGQRASGIPLKSPV